MVGVLKLMKIAYSATEDDIKNLFKTHSIFIEDIHWVLSRNGKKTGSAFIALQKDDLKKGQELDGIFFRGHQLTVLPSSAQEFNTFFPNTPMAKGIKQEWKNYNHPNTKKQKYKS